MKSIRIIGITGLKRSGKDTISDYINTNYKYNKVSFVKPLKDICKTLFDLTSEQLNGDEKEIIDKRYGCTPRKIMQFIGTDLFRNNMKIIKDSDNIWVNVLKRKLLKNKNKFVISDVRFQNEIDMIQSIGGIIIRVDRKDLIYKKDNHESENINSLKKINFTINNNLSLEHLYRKIDIIFKE
jgi:hypothetical protein